MGAAWARLSVDGALCACAVAEAGIAVASVVAFLRDGLGEPAGPALAWLAVGLWLLRRVSKRGRTARGLLVVRAGLGAGVLALAFMAAPHPYPATVALLCGAQILLLTRPDVRARVGASGVSPAVRSPCTR